MSLCVEHRVCVEQYLRSYVPKIKNHSFNRGIDSTNSYVSEKFFSQNYIHIVIGKG
jgi:hypothetical protein